MLNCCLKGKTQESDEKLKIEGTVVLMKKNVLDFTDFNAMILDDIHELVGKHVSFQLISATVADANNVVKGKLGKSAYLENWISSPTSAAIGESNFGITFNWDMEKYGVPGAVIVKNNHHSEFYLKSLTLENFPAKGKIHFDCKSWVYPVKYYSYERVFFTNNTYLLNNTPEALRQYRKEELIHLRGDDHSSELRTHDRIYGYAFYNDLGDPDKGPSYARPVLGGSKEYPYPRRGRTSRPPSKTDPNTESRLPGINLDIYVPRDERFGHLKLSDFLGNAIKVIAAALVPILNALVDKTPLEFDTFQDVLNLYEGGIELPDCPELDEIKDQIPWELIKDLFPNSGDRLFRLPMPQVIKEDKNAWRTDEEFAREMLAGVNPVNIGRLQEFPPRSKLDNKIYGDHTSSISVSHIESNLEGLTVDQAISNNRLFILDHHDTLMPYLNRINSDTGNKIYATRTLLFLKDDDTLKPLAIELSLPNPKGEQYGSVDKVFTPAKNGVEGSVWHLAKSYAAVNDSGIHQLISHWLDTHAVIEPFVIATNRQLSVMHPVYKLLSPHYRDTMNINALARQILINGNGLLELTVFPQKYSMEFSSVVYKNWKFTDAALPTDLIKRGVAVEDITQPMNLRLLIKDYPYAVDGLAIWSAIETWVEEYCSIYYTSDSSVQTDDELQAWWKEIREVGHGDKKGEPWWPEMKSLSDLTSSCTTIIWIASALHAAVNFAQYPYAGYLPNRPTISRQFMPEPYTEEYEELEKNPEKVFLKTITSQLQTIIGVSLIEVLSKHSSDEVYLGQRDTTEWTSDDEALETFKRFGNKLLEIEGKIMEMNQDKNLKNRNGPVKMPYTFLYPNTSDFSKMQVTGRGIPNSTSI